MKTLTSRKAFISVCRNCKGMGETIKCGLRTHNHIDLNIIKTCTECNGSGRVNISIVRTITISCYEPPS